MNRRIPAGETLRQDVLNRLRKAGFLLAGTAPVQPEAGDCAALDAYLENGCHASMAYLARNARMMKRPTEFEPWVRGAFCVALPYNTRSETSAETVESGSGWISRYAWGRDYHKVLKARLRPVARYLRENGKHARVCVDSAPVLERALARLAGLGFIGKNTMLINPRFGSYLFLGEILTDMALPPGDPVPDGCGRCTRCLEGCPTGAFARPRILDARRCLSMWTIEHRGPFTADTPELGGHLFGCDRCQEVCPYNRKAPMSIDPDFRPRPGWFAPEPETVSRLQETEWDRRTRGMALRRAGYAGLLRNSRRVEKEKRTAGQTKSDDTDVSS
ncbi:MAG: tRNA epoxyqueuosine(34) reductase QueG [Acidobacteriota bacterium]